MESLCSDEEDDLLPFWNNWLPPSKKPFTHKFTRGKVTTRFVSNPSVHPRISSIGVSAKYGGWIPPLSLSESTITSKKKISKKIKEKNGDCTEKDKSKENASGFMKNKRHFNGIIRDINGVFDRAKRMHLHDVTLFNDGDLFWGLVKLGVFAHIKLWVNDYGNICVSADGTVSKLGSVESTFISITNCELLRRMLQLSRAQWASLCETVQETKSVLKYDAFEDINLKSKTSLEKLWYFICKRRHLLPDLCMLVKLCGAVKCMKKFQIIPKIAVQEIKNSLGEPAP